MALVTGAHTAEAQAAGKAAATRCCNSMPAGETPALEGVMGGEEEEVIELEGEMVEMVDLDEEVVVATAGEGRGRQKRKPLEYVLGREGSEMRGEIEQPQAQAEGVQAAAADQAAAFVPGLDDLDDLLPSAEEQAAAPPRAALPSAQAAGVQGAVVQGGATNCGAALSAAADDATSRAAAINRQRCGECEGCMRGNCGECASCADMPRFGGQGAMRQACVQRRCLKMGSSVMPMSNAARLSRAEDEAVAAVEAARALATVAALRAEKASKAVPGARTEAARQQCVQKGLLRTLKGACGHCDACGRGDCGECVNCLDKPKFGGQGIRKVACLERKCRSLKTAQAAGSRQDDGAFAEEVDVEVLEVS